MFLVYLSHSLFENLHEGKLKVDIFLFRWKNPWVNQGGNQPKFNLLLANRKQGKKEDLDY